jgi:hypothetical protein
MKRSPLLYAFVALACVAACREAPRTPLEQLLHDMEAAVEARDADGVAALLTPDFRAQGGLTKAAIPGELRRYFFAYESLDLECEVVEASGEPPTQATLNVSLSGKPKDVGGLASLVPDATAYRFDLVLRGVEGRLQVAEAPWKPLAPESPE